MVFSLQKIGIGADKAKMTTGQNKGIYISLLNGNGEYVGLFKTNRKSMWQIL